MKTKSLTDAHAEYRAVVNSDLPDDSPERAQAVKKWDAALYNSGVYALAAQCLAAIDAEAATAKGDRKTALELARGLALSRTYASATLLALSKGKTFSQREAIRTAAAQAERARAEADEAALIARKRSSTQALVVALAARTAKREADEELDRKFKQAVIANGTPGAKARKRGGVTQKEAATLIGVSVSTIRTWERGEHTPEGYPGRGDAVLLRAFAGRREEGKRMKAAVIGAIRPRNMDNVSHRVERGGRW